jgi:hypothetical protein
MNLMNLTPHAIRVRVNDNRDATPDPSDIVLEPALAPARVSVQTVQVGDVNGIPVVSSQYGDIVNLPDPVDGVVYIVSMLVAQKAALDGRSDVVSPNTAPKQDIRYPDGHPQKGLTFAVFGFQRF